MFGSLLGMRCHDTEVTVIATISLMSSGTLMLFCPGRVPKHMLLGTRNCCSRELPT